MSNNNIEDNEIRIIKGTQKSDEPTLLPDNDNKPPRNRFHSLWKYIIIILIVILGLWLISNIKFCSHAYNAFTDSADSLNVDNCSDHLEVKVSTECEPALSKGYTEIIDTIINNEQLKIFIPHEASPHLAIGPIHYKNTTSTLIFQAADVRGDNHEINCAYVLGGNLISRGEAKAGYCAIIDGQINVGVERYTPLMEEAIEKGGDFFRQYPLVTGGVPVSNKLKSKSLRRALINKDNQIQVVMSSSRLSLDEFAEILADYGASEAIYLVGSAGYGKAKLENGEIFEFGDQKQWTNVNFIIWE